MSGAPRRIFAGAVGIAAVIAMRVGAASDTPIPLISLGQGVTPVAVGGVPVFLVRTGSVVTGLLATDPDSRNPLYWCPAEQAFVDPKTTSLYDARGSYVDGPSRHDMRRVRVRVDTVELTVRVDPRPLRSHGRSRGTVSGEAGEAWQRFAHGDRYARFCQNPVSVP